MRILEILHLLKRLARKEPLLVLAILGMNAEALAKNSERRSKKSSNSSESDRRRAAADESDIDDYDHVDPADRRPVALSFLAIGAGMSLSNTIEVNKELSFAGGLGSTSTKTHYDLANAPGFTLELCNITSGRLGVCIGGYYDQAKKIKSFRLEDSTKSYTLGNALDSEFSQYGGTVNASFSLEIPYAFVGINFGSGEVKFKDEAIEPIKYGGALGGQFGIGLRLGEYLALEASYKRVNFTKAEDEALADITTNITMNTTMATLKFMLH